MKNPFYTDPEQVDPEAVPIQYREGFATFFGMKISVDGRVLIPRPETELLVSVIEDACRGKKWKTPRILDVGTGSGAISLALSKRIMTPKIIASDISREALEVAEQNIRAHGSEDKIKTVCSDVFSAFGEEYRGAFDCIASNPPYVSAEDYEKLDEWVLAEPKQALYGGLDGMNIINHLVERSPVFLAEGGLLALEVGYDQSERTKSKLVSCGFSGVKGFFDSGGYERVIIGWKNG